MADSKLFDGVDLADPGRIRAIMIAATFMTRHTEVKVWNNLKGDFGLNNHEYRVIQSLRAHILGGTTDRWPLLGLALLRFLSVRLLGDEQVIRAARELNDLAPERTLTHPHTRPKEYDVAAVKYTALLGKDDARLTWVSVPQTLV